MKCICHSALHAHAFVMSSHQQNALALDDAISLYHNARSFLQQFVVTDSVLSKHGWPVEQYEMMKLAIEAVERLIAVESELLQYAVQLATQAIHTEPVR